MWVGRITTLMKVTKINVLLIEQYIKLLIYQVNAIHFLILNIHFSKSLMIQSQKAWLIMYFWLWFNLSQLRKTTFSKLLRDRNCLLDLHTLLAFIFHIRSFSYLELLAFWAGSGKMLTTATFVKRIPGFNFRLNQQWYIQFNSYSI